MIIPPGKKLEDLIRLSELCVDLLRQNEEFYQEVGSEREKHPQSLCVSEQHVSNGRQFKPR